MRQKTHSGVKFLLSIMVLSTTPVFGNAAADTMFDEGRAKGAFAAIEQKAGHKLHVLSLTIRPEELRLLASSPNKPGEVETWRMQATPARDVGNESPALLSSEPAQLISGSLEDNLIDMDVNGLAIVPQLAGAALTRARLQSQGRVTAMELRRLPKIIEPGVRDPSWRVHVQGLNEEAEIYANPNGEITLADLQSTKRAQTLNLLEGGPDFEEIIQNIRSRLKDKWAFHYIEVGKTQIDVDVKLMTVRNPRMIRFTATLDDLKTYATSIPHQTFLGEPADDRFSLDDVDFSQLAKLASIARMKLPIADGVVQRVSLSKPHRERGGNVEWQVRVRSAHAPLFMGLNTPPVAEGSVSFDTTGNVLQIKSPPGFASKTNLFDPTALQKAVDKIGERLGHHVLLTELMIGVDSIDITAQDPQNKSKLAVFAYKDEDIVRASEAKAAMANSFGAKSDWLWDLSMLRPGVVKSLTSLERQTLTRLGINQGEVVRITISKDKLFHPNNDKVLIEIRASGEGKDGEWVTFDLAGLTTTLNKGFSGIRVISGQPPRNR